MFSFNSIFVSISVRYIELIDTNKSLTTLSGLIEKIKCRRSNNKIGDILNLRHLIFLFLFFLNPHYLKLFF